MFWRKDKNHKNKTGQKTDKRGNATKNKERVSVGSEKDGHGFAGDDIRAQAMAYRSEAREHIGEDVLDRIAEAMRKKQNSVMERAKRDIAGADADKVLDELKFMLDHQKP